MSSVILTDAAGRPFEVPERPSAGADIESRIAYAEAVYRRNDAVSQCAGEAFARGLSESMRRPRKARK